VLQQTLPADEIIALDDGSTDDTIAILNSYAPRVTVLHQENRGVAAARNVLCARATGDLVAFLDSDDLWHPRYLETIRDLFVAHPTAVGYFTGHVNFEGYCDYQWKFNPLEVPTEIAVIDALSFIRAYNETTGKFASPSYLSIPRRVFQLLGRDPFRLDGVEDSYLCTTLPLLGSVVYAPAALVAYRITDASLSADRLKMFAPWVEVFRLLENRYREQAEKPLVREFELAFASRRRQYGKLLMAAGRAPEAREQFCQAKGNSSTPSSIAKSVGWLLASYLPGPLQPKWPPLRRERKTFVQS
jgi:glycosyltransferase involved in cell wall biosynthesis